jgi:hypothetical protein
MVTSTQRDRPRSAAGSPSPPTWARGLDGCEVGSAARGVTLLAAVPGSWVPVGFGVGKVELVAFGVGGFYLAAAIALYLARVARLLIEIEQHHREASWRSIADRVRGDRAVVEGATAHVLAPVLWRELVSARVAERDRRARSGGG